MNEKTKQKVLDNIRCILKNEIIIDSIEDIGIERLDIIGSRLSNKYREDSDLDILIEYTMDIKECDVFNMLSYLDLEYEGIKVDFFPRKIIK